MRSEAIIEVIMTKVKSNLHNYSEILEVGLTAKNVVVGSVSLYGDVPPDGKAPLRLQSRYLARMPEDKALTLKSQLQKEVESTLNRLPDDVTKVFVSDAARGLRKEVDTNPLFEDFEKIIDFFHATDHLSDAAEAIFGHHRMNYELRMVLFLNY